MGYSDGREFSDSLRTLVQKLADDMAWSLSIVSGPISMKEINSKFVYRDLFRSVSAKELKKLIEAPEGKLALRHSPIKSTNGGSLGLYNPGKHEYLTEFVAEHMPGLLADVNMMVRAAADYYDRCKDDARRELERATNRPSLEHRLQHGCGHCTCKTGCECAAAEREAKSNDLRAS